MTGGSEQASAGPGVANALRFLAAARTQDALCERVAALDPEAGLDGLLEIAGGNGYRFGADDLRRAFAHDWGFRRARYLRPPVPADSAASTVAVVNSPASSTKVTVSSGDSSGSSAPGEGIRSRADGSQEPSSS